MSDSITAITDTTSGVPAPEPVVAVQPDPVPSSTTSSYADTTTEVLEGDGSVVVTVTDAQGEVISTTTIQPQATVLPHAGPAHVLSFEA